MVENRMDMVKKIADSIPEEAKDCLGIAVVLIKPDGDLRTVSAYNPGGKLPLLAGLFLMQQRMAAEEDRMTDAPVPPRRSAKEWQ